jgi:hypothetical protein
MMSRILTWSLLTAMAGAFGVVGYRVLREQAVAGKNMPAYSVFSAQPTGLADAALVLEKLGWEAVALTQPIQHSPQRDASGCLLILAEPERASLLAGGTQDLNDIDVRSLLQWVERGNTLLLTSRHTTALHQALNLFPIHDTRTGYDETTEVDLAEAGGYTDHIDRLVVEGRDAVNGAAALPLWWVGEEPGAVLVGRGKGRVLVLADPSILTIVGLRQADNLRFLVNVAALNAHDEKVYFDEYHHGFRTGGGFWGYLHYHDQQWAVVLLLLALATAIWGVGVRLGRAVPAPPPSQADAVEYASAVARIYQRAGIRQLLAKTLGRDFLTALTRHLKLRRGAASAEVLAAWQRRHPADSVPQLQTLLEGAAELQEREVSPNELLTWARAMDGWR